MPRNIAFLHKDFPYGGAERITVDIARYTAGYGYNSFILTWNKHVEKITDTISLFSTIIELPDKKDQHSVTNALFIIDKIKEYDIRIFIIQGDELPYLHLLKKETETCKFIFSYHGKPFCEATYLEIYETERHTNNMPLPKRLEWKYIRSIKYRITRKYKKTVKAAYQRTYEQVDAFIVLCESYRDTFIKELKLDCQDNKITAIHNPEKEVPHPNLNKKKQIIFVGRMTHPDKRIDRLLHIWNKAYAQVPDWELLLIGEGPEKKKLENLSAELKLQRISFLGHCTNVNRFYQDATILCLTSTTEGWPLCLTEAQANGVIPIAYGCSAGIEAILHKSGSNGFIIPPFNARKYVKVLVKLLKDEKKQQEMRANVINKSKEYSIDIIGKQWVELFSKLLSKSQWIL